MSVVSIFPTGFPLFSTYIPGTIILSESLSLSEVFQLVGTYHVIPSETSTLTDVLTLGITGIKSESLSISDVVGVTIITTLQYLAFDDVKKSLARVSAIPPVDNTYDIGTTDYRFRSVYTVNLYTGDLVLGGRYRVIELPDGIYIYDIKTDKLYRIKISKVK